MSDSARRYLRERGYPPHVIDGGLARLLRDWDLIARSVAAGEVQYQDDYLNDMDGRSMLADMIPHLDPQQQSEARERVAEADARIRPHLNPTASYIWGEENAQKYGYSRDRHWWYYHRPRVIDATWRDS